MIRYKCAGCGFVLATVRVEGGLDRSPYRIVVELCDGKTYRGCIGAFSPEELARIVGRCPRCGRELSTKPVKIEVRPSQHPQAR
jgi:DNA-directed RNA polymerase subunit RPC12/RpoP